MVQTVVKRNGNTVEFDSTKIANAIIKAMKAGPTGVDADIAYSIADTISKVEKNQLAIYEIEEMVHHELCLNGLDKVARCYESYRTMREFQKKQGTIDDKVMGLLKATDESIINENSNKDSYIIGTQRDLMSEEVSKDISLRCKLPTHLAEAHINGLIHIHKKIVA